MLEAPEPLDTEQSINMSEEPVHGRQAKIAK